MHLFFLKIMLDKVYEMKTCLIIHKPVLILC
jgi:hypothetical protein